VNYPYILYEPNPDHSHPLRINRLQKKVELVLEWQDLDGKYHKELFRTISGHSLDGLSYIHEGEFPEDELRKFLQHCPLHDIKIYIRDY